MRKTLFILPSLLLVTGLFSGCANAEKKFSRGLNNSWEIVRGGEFRRSVEQVSLNDGMDAGFSAGFVRGLNRTFARTGLGFYEMITAPFPPYEWIASDYLPPGPAFPDNYVPGVMEDSMFATDSSVGFSGGDVAPMIPGSRFRVFDAP
jgi:putative exosortase-associated protein (TIGR04073 family)